MARVLSHVFPSSFREPRFHARYAVEILPDSWRISVDFIAHERDLRIRILDLVAHGLVHTIHLLYHIRLLYERRHARSFIGSTNSVFIESSIRTRRKFQLFDRYPPSTIEIVRAIIASSVYRPKSRSSGTNSTQNVRHRLVNTIRVLFFAFLLDLLATVSVSRTCSTHFLLFLSNSKSPWQVLTGWSGSSDLGIRSRHWQVAKRIACVWSFESLLLRHLAFTFFLFFSESSSQKFRCWAVCKLQVDLQGPSSTHHDSSRDRYCTRACSSCSVL